MSTYEKIKELCEKAGFPISAIREKVPGLSISKASITGWKKGSKPRPDKIKAIADFFGVTVEYLLDDTQPAEPSRPTATGSASNSYGFVLSENEKRLVLAYRMRPEMQYAVDTLLGIAADGCIADEIVKIVGQSARVDTGQK